MSSIKQLARRPLRWALGVLLVALAVSVLCVSVGQVFCARDSGENIENNFVTLAFPSDTYTDEADKWMASYAAAHPDIVTSANSAILASSYIPALTVDNVTDRIHYDHADIPPFDPYDRAVLEIRISEITRIAGEKSEYYYDEGIGWVLDDSNGAYYDIEGEVLGVIALEEGYSDPTGFTARITLELASVDDLDALGIKAGERYIVYCPDYTDLDYKLRSQLSQIKNMALFDAFDHSFFEVHNGYNYAARVKYGDLYTGITRTQLTSYRSVQLVLKNHADVGNSDSEYITKYANPFIAHLDGTAQEFLECESGADFARLVDEIRINNRTFATIGTDGVMDITHFARGKAKIVAGRDMTEEEIASGAPVCLISETVANKSGIKVGDKLDLSFYEKDVLYPGEKTVDEMSANPTSAHFGAYSTLGESREFEVIGIYHKADEWAEVRIDPYGFTPNTVFVPKGAISVEGESSHLGLFRSFTLKNESLGELAQAISDAGYDEALLFDDNGYADVKQNLSDYEETANRILPLAFGVWLVVAVLFLILYPCREGAVLDTMDSLGCNRRGRIRYVLEWTLGITVPGSMLGILLGALIWDYVISALASLGGAEISMDVNYGYFALISVSQLIILTLIVAVAAIPLTRSRGFDRRKAN